MFAAVAAASMSLGAQSAPVPKPAPAVKPAAKAWSVPRTADGQPDLTGDWTNATYTPLERPANLGDKEFYTAEEAAAVEKQRVAQFEGQAADNIHYDDAIWQNENYKKGLSTPTHVADRAIRLTGGFRALTEEARRRPLPPQAGSPDRRTDSSVRPDACRALHHVGQRRPADHAGRLQRQPRHLCRDPATSWCARR